MFALIPIFIAAVYLGYEFIVWLQRKYPNHWDTILFTLVLFAVVAALFVHATYTGYAAFIALLLVGLIVLRRH